MNNTDWKILIYLREERSINKVAKRLFNDTAFFDVQAEPDGKGNRMSTFHPYQ